MTSVARVRELNDQFRQTFEGGTVNVTFGVYCEHSFMVSALDAVKRFDGFTADNDPYQEHDFGAVIVDGEKVFWKIDYYGTDMTSGSPDPSDPSVTKRVLTVMLAHEY